MTNRGDAKLAGLRLNESGKQETRNGDRGQNGRNLRNPRSVFLSSCFPKDRKSTRLNSSHSQISYAVFCLKKKMTHSFELVSKQVAGQTAPSYALRMQDYVTVEAFRQDSELVIDRQYRPADKRHTLQLPS